MKRDGLAHGAHVHTTQPQLDAEASRLVPAVSTQRERRQGTATSSLFNLIISAVGAGLLSYVRRGTTPNARSFTTPAWACA